MAVADRADAWLARAAVVGQHGRWENTMRSVMLTLLVLVAGCASSPFTNEEGREIVLTYVGHEVGTFGPIAKNGGRDLDALSEKDRKEAMEMLARGGHGFLVIEPNASVPNRVIILSGKRVIGDFPAPKKTS